MFLRQNSACTLPVQPQPNSRSAQSRSLYQIGERRARAPDKHPPTNNRHQRVDDQHPPQEVRSRRAASRKSSAVNPDSPIALPSRPSTRRLQTEYQPDMASAPSGAPARGRLRRPYAARAWISAVCHCCPINHACSLGLIAVPGACVPALRRRRPCKRHRERGADAGLLRAPAVASANQIGNASAKLGSLSSPQQAMWQSGKCATMQRRFFTTMLCPAAGAPAIAD